MPDRGSPYNTCCARAHSLIIGIARPHTYNYIGGIPNRPGIFGAISGACLCCHLMLALIVRYVTSRIDITKREVMIPAKLGVTIWLVNENRGHEIIDLR